MFRSRPTLATVLAAAAVAIAAAAGCGPRANPPGSAATLAPAARVSSSIPDGAELTGPVRWEARVSGIAAGGVAAVRFFIDGELKYVTRQAPYLFAGRGNLLPGTLGPGTHVFAVDVTLTDGRRLTTAATAVVSAKARGTPRQVRPSGPSATINAPAAIASGTAPSPGETTPTQANGDKRQAGPETHPPGTHQAGPPVKEET